MKTFQFPSKSSDATHVVTLHDGGKLTCTCRGFKTPSRCWHVKKIAEQEGLTAVIGGELIRPATTPSLFGEPMICPVSPMLARGLKDGESIDNFNVRDHVMEVKYDGHRRIIRRAEEITAWSRAGNIVALPEQILVELRRMPFGIYDGELMIPGMQATDVKSHEYAGRLMLYIFDIMQVVDTPCMTEPLLERRKLLEVAMANIPLMAPVQIASQFEPSREKLQELWDGQYEGAIVKRWDSPYLAGYRSKDWVKFKEENAGEATIVGFTIGRLGPHSIINAVDKDGIEVNVKSLNDEWRADFAKNAASYIGRTLRFTYQNKTRDGRYRHPMADHIV